MYIDGSVYPDLDESPRALEDPQAKADYLHRVCAAWDYGVPPDAQTIGLLARWRDVFDRFPIPTSPAYHALRAWFDWPPVAMPAGLHPPTPRYVAYDRQEGRPEDPCEGGI